MAHPSRIRRIVETRLKRATDLAGNAVASFSSQTLLDQLGAVISPISSVAAEVKTITISSVTSGAAAAYKLLTSPFCDATTYAAAAGSGSSVTLTNGAGSVTLSSESANGKYFCLKVTKSGGHPLYARSNVVAGIDTTDPTASVSPVSGGYVNAAEDDSAVTVAATVSGDTTSTSFSITDGTDTLTAKTGLASAAFREKLHTSVGGNTLRTGGEFSSGVSRDGDILAIGVPADDVNRKGAVYIVTDHDSDGSFTDSGTTVRKVNDSAAGITLNNYDNFGRSVYLSGDTLVVGATGHSSYRGGVYVITDTDNDKDWTDGTADAVQVISSGAPSDITLATADYFGSAVSLRDNVLVVGANGDDTGGSERGTVYVITDHDHDSSFTDSGTIVSEINGGHGGITLTDSDYFGSSLALHEGILAIGVPNDDSGGADRGAVLLLTDHDYDNNWMDAGTTVTKIHTTLRDGTGTHTITNGSKIGGSLALIGNRLFIGARAAESSRGSVYLLADTDNDHDWTDSGTTLTPLHSSAGTYTLDSGDQFGSSLHAGPDSVIIGAMYDDDGVSNAGAVYMHDHSAVVDIATGEFEKDGTPTAGDSKLAAGTVTITATATDSGAQQWHWHEDLCV